MSLILFPYFPPSQKSVSPIVFAAAATTRETTTTTTTTATAATRLSISLSKYSDRDLRKDPFWRKTIQKSKVKEKIFWLKQITSREAVLTEISVW